MRERIVVDAPYGDDTTNALFEGLRRLGAPSTVEKLETRECESVIHADFPLHTYAIQEWPGRSRRSGRMEACARALTGRRASWITDESEIDEVKRRLDELRSETHGLLLAHGVDCDRLLLDQGGPWRPVRILDAAWCDLHHPLIPAVRRIHTGAPRLLWIRTESGRRKWNARIGRESPVRLDDGTAPGIVDVMRAAARQAG